MSIMKQAPFLHRSRINTITFYYKSSFSIGGLLSWGDPASGALLLCTAQPGQMRGVIAHVCGHEGLTIQL